VNRSVFRIPKMDCPTEEQLVRMALEGLDGIRELSFDLPGRTLSVWHEKETDPITRKLEPLALGAQLTETVSVTDLPSSSTAGSGSDETEARTLWVLLSINASMFVVELVAGWLAESTGLIADSLDMFADATVYGVALYAVGRSASLKQRAAHLTGWLQVGLAVGALSEVLRRLVFGSAPEAPAMMGIALLALAANATCLALIARNRHYGVHMMAVFICSATDVIANAGVIAAGALVAWTGSNLPDLVIGSVIGIVVLAGGIRILRLR
jgi:Co/Zn/Cd efflux system component